jgi:FlaA1/EpsC-like NDP-sugar epimerase
MVPPIFRWGRASTIEAIEAIRLNCRILFTCMSATIMAGLPQPISRRVRDRALVQTPSYTHKLPPYMSQLSFKGHTVVITGAGGGLGKAYVCLITHTWSNLQTELDITDTLCFLHPAVLTLLSMISTAKRLRRS